VEERGLEVQSARVSVVIEDDGELEGRIGRLVPQVLVRHPDEDLVRSKYGHVRQQRLGDLEGVGNEPDELGHRHLLQQYWVVQRVLVLSYVESESGCYGLHVQIIVESNTVQDTDHLYEIIFAESE